MLFGFLIAEILDRKKIEAARVYLGLEPLDPSSSIQGRWKGSLDLANSQSSDQTSSLTSRTTTITTSTTATSGSDTTSDSEIHLSDTDASTSEVETENKLDKDKGDKGVADTKEGKLPLVFTV